MTRDEYEKSTARLLVAESIESVAYTVFSDEVSARSFSGHTVSGTKRGDSPPASSGVAS
jgi:hypothetical protein